MPITAFVLQTIQNYPMQERIARRFWNMLSWDMGINKSMDGKPVTFDLANRGHRAFCMTLARIAIDEIHK